MGAATYIGRVGGLAVALGVGTAVITGHGTALADDGTSSSTSLHVIGLLTPRRASRPQRAEPTATEPTAKVPEPKRAQVEGPDARRREHPVRPPPAR